MPPLPLVAFEVMRARVGTPASLPAPTPTPVVVPTPGPCFTGASCTASGAPCSSARSSFMASRPMPAALRRAASISPGGLSGSGTRASGTGASLLRATRAGAGLRGGSGRCCGLSGSGLAAGVGSGCGTAGLIGSAAIFTGGGGGGGGLSCSSSRRAIGSESSAGWLRSGWRTGSHGMAMKTIPHVMSTRPATRLKRCSSSAATDHGSTARRNDTRGETRRLPPLSRRRPLASLRLSEPCSRRDPLTLSSPPRVDSAPPSGNARRLLMARTSAAPRTTRR